VNRQVLWRAALLQAASVIALALLLARALPHSFFEKWGWLAGSAAWLLCAAITAQALRLPLAKTIGCAVLAGIASVVGVVAGVHWLGVAVAIAAFGALCGRIAAGRGGAVAWS
jgi:hypothetical protein